MRKTTLLVIAFATMVGPARSAQADYVGLVTIIEPLGPSPAGPRDVYRVYAEFTNPSDRVDAWYGTIGIPMTIQNVMANGMTLGIGFTNFGGSGGILPPETPGSARDWDTFGTIGIVTGEEAPFGNDETTALNIPNFITGNSLALTNGQFSIPPTAPQGRADYRVVGSDTNLRVLLMQLVVNVGEHVRGTINVGGEVDVLGEYRPFTAAGQTFTSVPAPNGLLIGISGISVVSRGARRRFQASVAT